MIALQCRDKLRARCRACFPNVVEVSADQRDRIRRERCWFRFRRRGFDCCALIQRQHLLTALGRCKAVRCALAVGQGDKPFGIGSVIKIAIHGDIGDIKQIVYVTATGRAITSGDIGDMSDMRKVIDPF